MVISDQWKRAFHPTHLDRIVADVITTLHTESPVESDTFASSTSIKVQTRCYAVRNWLSMYMYQNRGPKEKWFVGMCVFHSRRHILEQVFKVSQKQPIKCLVLSCILWSNEMHAAVDVSPVLFKSMLLVCVDFVLFVCCSKLFYMGKGVFLLFFLFWFVVSSNMWNILII